MRQADKTAMFFILFSNDQKDNKFWLKKAGVKLVSVGVRSEVRLEVSSKNS